MSGFKFNTIESCWFPLRVIVAAEPSGGKTLSAIKLALGLANGDGSKVFVLDTDNGRCAALYGGEFQARGVKYARFDPPFSPARFGEGIEAAEKAGAEVLIIDCVSDGVEAPGGLSDMAERDKGSWLRPKNQHFLKFVNRANVSPMHIIFTVTAKTISLPEKERANFQLKNAARLAAPDVQLVCEKSFTRPMTMCLFVAREGQETAVFKAHNAIQLVADNFGGPIVEEHGKLLRAWADNTVKMVDPTVEKWRGRLRLVTEKGIKATQDAITKTPKNIADALGEDFFDEILAAAEEYDRLAAASSPPPEGGE